MTAPASSSSATQQLLRLGQSTWLDYISRGLISSGELARMIADGDVVGMTSNPTIFDRALASSKDYDASIRDSALRGVRDPYAAFVDFAADDIRLACDALTATYESMGGQDGFVSLEVPPGIEHDRDATIAEARRLAELVGRPNLMIKVPGTPAGVEALEVLIAEGVNVNVTLLFAVGAYEAVAEGYLRGLEARLARGLDLTRVASVASFFVSRVDTAVDALLPADSPLRGTIAVANARRAYGRFQHAFSGPRWERLAALGARVQRPLWASTGTKNPAYSDILYVEDLVAPFTVNTMPEATLRAVQDHLDVRVTIDDAALADAEAKLNALAAAGIDLDAVTARLLVEGLAAFQKDFDRLLSRVGDQLECARVTAPGTATLGTLAVGHTLRLDALDRDNAVARIWAKDHTVWKPDPTEITDRLGWLHVAEAMLAEVEGLRAFAAEAAADGFTDAVVLGMGGSSLAPEVFRETFGVAPGCLDLHVLDSTDPGQIIALEERLDLSRTLFVVSSKSGGTIETRSQFDYFFAKCPDGRQYAIVTDPGSALEALGRERGARRIFLNPSDIGGRYSALSLFGLVPAALLGVDLDRLLGGALAMASACTGPVAENPGAWLGALMGDAALMGRDKLTLVLPPGLQSLGYWIEQLVAESTGKEGKGIVLIEGEDAGAPGDYGNDRLFVAVGDHVALAALEAAGQPVARLPYEGPWQLGAEFFRWEFATAVASAVMGIQPFDQPNVQEAKDATNAVLAGQQASDVTPSVADVLARVRAMDYIAILAYLPRDPETIARLQAVRMRLRDRYRVATTVGFGPRFLHSTGQLHKGGPNQGVFLQVTGTPEADLPIPGRPYTFATLEAAQALGDLASLRAHGRRVARLTLEELEALGT